jgi:sorbitol-specific phosphotransferase system component IIA
MYPPIYAACAVYAPLTALVGTAPVRVYPFGDAPQDVALPYVVWQIIGGSPYNHLDSRPQMDRIGVQVDVYAASAASARDVGQKLRDCLEPLAHVMAFRGESKEPDTGVYRLSLDMEWHEATVPGAAGTYSEADWLTPTLLNSWVNYGGTMQPAQYKRIGDRVYIRGVVKSGTGSPIFTLPAGYRPPYDIGFTVEIHDNSNNPDFGHIRITQNGDLTLEHPGTLNNHKVWFNLSFFTS